MSTFLQPSDIGALRGVDPRMILTVLRAAELIAHDKRNWIFRVTSGVRTVEEQEKLLAQGASQTLDSAHIRGLAVDLAILAPDRSVANWDFELYRDLAEYMRTAHRHVCQKYRLRGSIFWGGDWSKLRDGPHFELR